MMLKTHMRVINIQHHNIQGNQPRRYPRLTDCDWRRPLHRFDSRCMGWRAVVSTFFFAASVAVQRLPFLTHGADSEATKPDVLARRPRRTSRWLDASAEMVAACASRWDMYNYNTYVNNIVVALMHIRAYLLALTALSDVVMLDAACFVWHRSARSHQWFELKCRVALPRIALRWPSRLAEFQPHQNLSSRQGYRAKLVW